jgi:serine O-acetyltransferase
VDGADEERMFENLRDDYQAHGRTLKSGGFLAMAVYRFGRWSLEQPAPVRWLASRVYARLRSVSHFATGVVLERETKIGRSFHIIHTGMISIHPDVVIGDRVGIMHGATLGTNMGSGVPVIGNDVFIGCHASVLGNVKIGDGARIAANSLVITDVPPGAIAIGVPAKVTTLNLGAVGGRTTKSAASVPAEAALKPASNGSISAAPEDRSGAS